MLTKPFGAEVSHKGRFTMLGALFIGACGGGDTRSQSGPVGSDAGAEIDASGAKGAADAQGDGSATSDAPIQIPPGPGPWTQPCATSEAGPTGPTTTDGGPLCAIQERVALLAEVAGAVGPVAVDSTHIYFAEYGPSVCVRPLTCVPGDGRLYRAPRCGGGVEPVSDHAALYRVLVDAGPMLYWTAGLLPVLGRTRKSDGAFEVLVSDTESTTAVIAANATHAYVINFINGSGTLSRIAHDSTTLETLAPVDSQGCGTFALSVSENGLLWSAGLGAFRAGLDGTNAGEFYRATLPIGAVASDSAAAFLLTVTDGNQCVDAGIGEILRLPLSGEPEEALHTLVEPQAAQVVGSHLLWTDAGAGVMRVPVLGGDVERIAPWTTTSLTVAGDRLVVGSGNSVVGWKMDPLPDLEPFDAATAAAPVWEVKTGRDTSGLFDRAVMDASGAVVVAGSSGSPTNLGGGTIEWTDPATITGFVAKYDAAGAYQWSVEMGDFQSYARTACLAVGSDGRVITSLDNSGTTVLRALSSSGQTFWQTSLDVAAGFCSVGPGGEVYATGDSEFATESTILRFDGVSGAESWRVPVARPETNAFGGPIVALADGAIAVLASSTASSIHRFDATGTTVWTLDAPGSTIRDLVRVPDGGIVALGESRGSVQIGTYQPPSPSPMPGFVNSFIAKLDVSGAVTWVKYLQNVGISTSSADYFYFGAQGLAVDPSGTVFVRGMPGAERLADLGSSCVGARPENVFLAAFDPEGRHIWTRQFPAPTGQTVAIAAGAPGRVVVAGSEDWAMHLIAF